MSIANTLFAWLSIKKLAALRVMGWTIVLGNVYLVWTLPFLPFKMSCFDSGIITFYTNFHYRYLTTFAEGPTSAAYPYTVLFHSKPNRFSSTVKPNLSPVATKNTPKLEMNILIPLAMWFDGDYFANAMGDIASPIIEEDYRNTWKIFEKEVMLLFPYYRYKTVCAAYHIIATEGRVPNVEDILLEREKLYSYIK